MHPAVIGELAYGNLNERDMILRYFHAMPLAVSATDREALELLEKRRLSGSDIGWIGVHLLASALLTGCRLWTLNGPLVQTSEMLGVCYRPIHTEADAEQ